MEKKRSIGVTIYAWFFIVGGILGLIGAFINRIPSGIMARGIMLSVLYFLGLVVTLAGLACGVYLLKLKPWARRLALALCLYQISLLPFAYRINMAVLNNREMLEQIITERDSGAQGSELEEVKKYGSMVIIFVLLISLIWNLTVFYFFTRPKVREQFLVADLTGS